MKCCICGKTIRGFGNNPDPIKNASGELFNENARCCNDCNDKYVVPYRLAQIFGSDEEVQAIQDKVNNLRKKTSTKRKLIAVIERPDGTTYEQEIEYTGHKRTSINLAQKELGYPYYWITANGYKFRKLKKNAYLIVDAYFVEVK